MTIGTGFALYFLFWWLCIFVVLPFGVRSQAESGDIVPGTEQGAPVKTNLKKKLLINTVLSALVFAVYWFVTVKLGYSLDDIPLPSPEI